MAAEKKIPTYQEMAERALSEKPVKANTYVETVETLTNHVYIYFDEDSRTIIYTWKNNETDQVKLTPIDIVDYLKRTYNMRISEKTIMDIARCSRNQTKISHVKSYFKSLEGKWKPGDVSHIDKISQYVKVHEFENHEPGYYQARFMRFLKKWLIVATAQILGQTINDVMPIFRSVETGIGKSTLANFLTFRYDYAKFDQKPNHANYYFSEKVGKNELDLNKSTKILSYMSNKMFLNFDEMEGLTKPNSPLQLTLRRLMSEATINTGTNTRPEYTPRMGYFIGTCNPFWIGLIDRRQLFIELESVSIQLYKEVDIDLVYAEAVYALNNGYNPFWTEDERDDIKQEAHRYLKVAEEEEIILKYFKPLPTIPAKVENGKNFFTATAMLEYIKEKDKTVKQSTSVEQIGTAAKKHFNGPKDKVWVDGKGLRGYYCKKV